MSPDHLISLLAAGAGDDPRRSPVCPDEQQIAGYVDGGLDKAARARVELHLADCGRCLTLVGLLCRERDADAIESLTNDAVVHASTVASKGPQRRWRLAPQWAAAAAMVMAVPFLLHLGRSPDRGAEGQGRPDPSSARTLASTATVLQVLSPGAGTAVDPQRLSFSWTEVVGTPYYDVRIVTETGDVVIRQRVIGTTWRPSSQLQLQAGAEYFVHIDAYPSGDKSVSSDHVPFRISD
jgi:hypothetical protein